MALAAVARKGCNAVGIDRVVVAAVCGALEKRSSLL